MYKRQHIEYNTYKSSLRYLRSPLVLICVPFLIVVNRTLKLALRVPLQYLNIFEIKNYIMFI